MKMKNVTRVMLFVVICLVIFGALLILSSTGSMPFFKAHVTKVLIAFAGFFTFMLIPYEYYKKYSKYALLFSILLLVLTPILGTEKNGARRWIELWFFSFQPSEMAKIVLIMHIAVMIEKKGELIADFKKGFRYALVWIGLVCLLVMIQPNVSNATIIMLISFTVLYVGGARLKHIAVTLGSLALTGMVAIFTFYPHAVSRIMAFLTDEHMQVKQAKIALGSGGLLGLGLGNSRASDRFVPEPYGDFIFSILGEETGFIGAFMVLMAYLVIFIAGIIISKRAKDSFGQLFAFGVSFTIILSAFINVAVVTGMAPTTGITLPFISFGGTSLLVFAISIGILMNIAMQNKAMPKLKIEAQTVGS